MYQIGKHVTTEAGPNVQGSMWSNITNNTDDDLFAADNSDKSWVEIIDNGDGSYTVFGVLVDNTRGKELYFTFTDNKPVFAPWG